MDMSYASPAIGKRKHIKNKKQNMAGDLLQWCKHLPDKHKVMSLMPGTKTQNKTKQKTDQPKY